MPKQSNEEILKEFRSRFKNPKNTGYRVGQEFLGAVEEFILSKLKQKDQEKLEWQKSIKKQLPKIENSDFSRQKDCYEKAFREAIRNNLILDIKDLLES